MDDITLTQDEMERIENLQDQAELFGLEVDWESLELIPKRVTAKKWQFEEQDNWAGSPEQAHA